MHIILRFLLFHKAAGCLYRCAARLPVLHFELLHDALRLWHLHQLAEGHKLLGMILGIRRIVRFRLANLCCLADQLALDDSLLQLCAFWEGRLAVTLWVARNVIQSALDVDQVESRQVLSQHQVIVHAQLGLAPNAQLGQKPRNSRLLLGWR